MCPLFSADMTSVSRLIFSDTIFNYSAVAFSIGSFGSFSIPAARSIIKPFRAWCYGVMEKELPDCPV